MKNENPTARRVAFIAATIALAAAAAFAAAPPVKTQAPGFYRMTLGDFEVTAILDGTIALEVNQILTNVKPGQVDELLARAFLKSPVETSVNAFLINTGAKLVLVDAGAGTLFGPTGGNFLANLQAAGYRPEQIDDIAITHMHGDHIGGLAASGQRNFPNAVVHADKHDAELWMDAAGMEKAPPERKGIYKGAITSITPYVTADKFRTFEAGAQIVPGITSINAHGHTPGHTIYAVESKGQKLVLWGDLLHVGAVQFPEPTVTINFDIDSPTAYQQRAKALKEAASQGHWVGIAHVPFPGIGHVRAEGKGYTWVPVNYSANR